MKKKIIIVLCSFITIYSTSSIAQIKASLTVSEPKEVVTQSSSSCPFQSGVITSVSIPNQQSLKIGILLSDPAPAGGAQFRVSMDDPSIAAAGDKDQGFFPILTVPSGAQQSINKAEIFGRKVGSTQLVYTSLTSGVSNAILPVAVWDINEKDNAFLDTNPEPRGGIFGFFEVSHCRASDDSGDISTDINVLSKCGKPVKGVATDGISKLLMRINSGLSGTACYEIISSSSFNQGVINPAVTSTSPVMGLNQAFSFYTAPDEIDSTKEFSEVEVEFSFTPEVGFGNTSRKQAKFKLVRPPVLLVHGIWSDQNAWDESFYKNDKFITHRADYGSSNADNFSKNFPKIQEFVKKSIKNLKDKSYAVTKTDVVSHSMGGILSRLYIQSDKFNRPNNFNKG